MLTYTRQDNPLFYNFYSFKVAFEKAEKEVSKAKRRSKES